MPLQEQNTKYSKNHHDIDNPRNLTRGRQQLTLLRSTVRVRLFYSFLIIANWELLVNLIYIAFLRQILLRQVQTLSAHSSGLDYAVSFG